MTTKKIFRALSATFAAAILLYACSKDNSSQPQVVPPGQQHLSIFMTDGPGFFDSVLIDIQSVQVLIDTCEHRDHWEWDDDHRGGGRADSCMIWDSLSITPGVYDLLSLRNGLDTLLASGTVADGKVKMIKIRLGPDNSLVKDSIHYPLHFPPGFDSVVAIRLFGGEWEDHGVRRHRCWLDFDLGRSIIQVRQNEFFLRPVFRLFLMSSTGSISGSVQPWAARPVITVSNSTDTAYALPNWDGRFKVWGLKNGTYDVFINGSNGYQDTTITGVQVNAGQNTRLDPVTLHK